MHLFLDAVGNPGSSVWRPTRHPDIVSWAGDEEAEGVTGGQRLPDEWLLTNLWDGLWKAFGGRPGVRVLGGRCCARNTRLVYALQTAGVREWFFNFPERGARSPQPGPLGRPRKNSAPFVGPSISGHAGRPD